MIKKYKEEISILKADLDKNLIQEIYDELNDKYICLERTYFEEIKILSNKLSDQKLIFDKLNDK